MILIFMVRRCLGTRASGETDDVVLSVVSGRLFTTTSASHMNVRRAFVVQLAPILLQEFVEDASYSSNLPLSHTSHVTGPGSIEVNFHPVAVPFQ